jgi:hypothetical protein
MATGCVFYTMHGSNRVLLKKTSAPIGEFSQNLCLYTSIANYVRGFLLFGQ